MKLKKQNLTETMQAYQKIKEMIIKSEVEPGQVLSILYFSELLGIGRMPTTSACQKLEAEGFLTIIPKKGVLITPISISDVRDLYEAREALEMYLGERAFGNITAHDISVLEQSIKRQEKLAKANDAYGFMKEDTFFHRYILNRYQNKALLNLHEQLTDRIFIIGVKSSKVPGRMVTSIENHKRQVECIKNLDKEQFLKEVSENQMSGYYSMTTIYSSI